MNFDITPFAPLKAGLTAVEYAEILRNYQYIPHPDWPMLSGMIQVDDGLRGVRFGLEGDVVLDIEITEIKKGDTFCGVPMRQRPKKFQKLLADAGFKSRIEGQGLFLENHPISFFIEGGWIASICWERPRENPSS